MDTTKPKSATKLSMPEKACVVISRMLPAAATKRDRAKVE